MNLNTLGNTSVVQARSGASWGDVNSSNAVRDYTKTAVSWQGTWMLVLPFFARKIHFLAHHPACCQTILESFRGEGSKLPVTEWLLQVPIAEYDTKTEEIQDS